jgi:hypothetical protein
MAICPLCNALKEMEIDCPKCNIRLNDGGEVSDYLDVYGHYNDEETKWGTAIQIQLKTKFVLI